MAEELEDLFAITSEVEDDFFGAEDTNKQKKPKETGEEEEEDDENKSDDLFDDEPVNTDDDEDDNKNTFNKLSFLKEKGVIDFTDEELEGVEDEEEFIDNKLEEVVESRVKELFDEVPDENKQVIQYLVKGGNINDLLGTLSGAQELDADLDMESEENQEMALRALMAKDNEPQDYIDSYIKTLKDTGRLKIVAEPKYNKWKTGVEKEKQELLDSQESQRQKQREAVKKAKQESVEFLKDKNELGIIPITQEDKKVLPSYMVEKSVTLQNGQKISQLHYDLFYKVMANKTSAAQLALIVKSVKEDGTLDFKRIENTIKTKGTKEIKDELERAKQSKRPGKSNGNVNAGSRKNLADYF